MVMPRRSPVEEVLGLPSFGALRALISGATGRQIDKLLARLEKLSQDKEGLIEMKRLLEYCERLDREGTLDKVVSILEKMPSGTSGKATIVELRKLLDDLSTKLAKFNGILSLLEGDEKT